MLLKRTLAIAIFTILTAFVVVPQAYSATDNPIPQQCAPVKRPGSVAEDTDVNLDARNKPKLVTDQPKTLVDVGGPTDDAAPQFSTLFGPTLEFNPKIADVYQLYLNDGKTLIPYDISSNQGVTQIELKTDNPVLAPALDYDLGGDILHYAILYINEKTGTITLKGTPEDNAVRGYTIHITGLEKIDPEIVKKYNESNDLYNRTKLAAISCGYPVGTPKNQGGIKGKTFRIAIADTGTFIDPRTRKDWWKTPPPAWIATRDCGTKIGFVDNIPTPSCTVVQGPPDVVKEIKVPFTVGFWVGQLRDKVIESVKGEVKPANDIVNAPDQTRNAGQLAGANDKLMTQTHKKEVKQISRDLSFSASTTVCHTGSENGNSQTKSSAGFFQFLAKGWAPFIGNALTMNALTNTGKLAKKDLNFDASHPQQIVGNQTFPCDTDDTGDDVPSTQVKADGTSQYAGDGQPYEFDLAKHFSGSQIAEVLANIARDLCDTLNCKLDIEPTMTINVQTKTPYVREIMAASDRAPSGKETGFTNIYRPGLIKTEKRVAMKDASFSQTVGTDKKNVEGHMAYEALAGIDQGMDTIRCGTTTIGQKDRPANCKITDESNSSIPTLLPDTSNWALSGNQTPIGQDFSIPLDTTDVGKAITTATKGNIPRCVLEAVKYIETGKDWNPSTQCQINRCSAAGPFQMTTGYAPYPMADRVYQMAPSSTNLITDCRQCSPSFQRKYEAYMQDPKNNPKPQCPNAWDTDWPHTPTDSNPCSIADASKQAVRLLQDKAAYFAKQTMSDSDPKGQKRTIILAGDSYYGSSVKIKRLGDCSYGEFVYKHCDPSYRCGSSGIQLP